MEIKTLWETFDMPDEILNDMLEVLFDNGWMSKIDEREFSSPLDITYFAKLWNIMPVAATKVDLWICYR